MPRIQAASIEEHVERQQRRIVAAATRLFRRRGLRGVDMGDVAEAAGLKRSSLYRYYPNIEDLFATCVEEQIRPVLADLRRAMSEASPGWPRLEAWVTFQMEFATGPQHASLAQMREIRDSAPRLRAVLAELHGLANQSLAQALAEIGSRRPSESATLAAFIGGMTSSAAMLAIERGAADRIRRELLAAVRRVVAVTPAPPRPRGQR